MSVTLETTLGILKIELFCEITPKAARNFLGLAGSGFYEGTIFHRNIREFVLQGGAPRGKKKGGTSIYGEPFENEIDKNLKFDKRGLVAMANGGPKTNKSQFFITYGPHENLTSTATIFGKLIHGWETLEACEKTEVDSKNRPIQPITILKTTIHANPFAMDDI